MIVRATLIKRTTDDGLVGFKDDIPLGRIYNVRSETRVMWNGFNFEKNKAWYREMIEAAEGGWIPTELLQIEG